MKPSASAIIRWVEVVGIASARTAHWTIEIGLGKRDTSIHSNQRDARKPQENGKLQHDVGDRPSGVDVKGEVLAEFRIGLVVAP